MEKKDKILSAHNQIDMGIILLSNILKQLNCYWRSQAPTFHQAPLVIGNFYNFFPFLTFDS
jgi:hypothetical protein